MTDAITEKYKDKVTPEYRAAITAIHFAAGMLQNHKAIYDSLLEGKRYMDNVGGLLDPTLYRDLLQSKNFERQLRLVQATLTFLAAVDEVETEFAKD